MTIISQWYLKKVIESPIYIKLSYLRRPMAEKHFISVILPLKLEWEPCYYSTEKVETGDRVSVMFAGRSYTGVVCRTDVVPDIDHEKVKSIIEIEKGLEKVLEEEIALWRKVAGYYLCSVGEVYKAAYPLMKVNMEKARVSALGKALQRQQKILSAVDAKLARLHGRLRQKKELAEKTREGTKAKAALVAGIARIEEEITLVNESRAALADPQSSLMTGHPAQQNDMQTDRHTVRQSALQTLPGISLSAPQEKAYTEILNGFSMDKPVLLHGVTGSGKTEIYMKLAMETISEGKNVLYLVPEIALSRQLEDRLHEHFGNRLLTFHSGENAASRRNSTEIIRNMTPEHGGYIALCTRSGLFLPHHDLGLIVVDEEHDSSYKQDSPAPRYNGRDTALMLSLIHSSHIILGSATPSLEEIYNTTTGRHVPVELKERFHGSDNSEIELIDTRAERSKRGMVGNFSRKLIDHIRHALASGEQVLILRSRRAWSTSLQCETCGEIQKCPHCSVSLSHHKAEGRMTCHYCGYTASYTGICRKCGGHLLDLGAGTQKIEEEASTLFPEARIARLDSDTTQKAKIIKDFSKGELDIIIGTQIITKGFDFERLGLVAVIAADTLLGIHDFRADEKAMHLLEQFRGRCGRRERKGLFVIQTSQPEHPIYQSITTDSPQSFNHRLLMERKDFDFPPFTRIIELTVKDIYEDRAERMAQRLAGALQDYCITGPYAPVIDKIADRYIRKIRLSLKKDKSLISRKDYLKKKIGEFEKANKYEGHIAIDVDPA